jgi:hypothetical protein
MHAFLGRLFDTSQMPAVLGRSFDINAMHNCLEPRLCYVNGIYGGVDDQLFGVTY